MTMSGTGRMGNSENGWSFTRDPSFISEEVVTTAFVPQPGPKSMGATAKAENGSEKVSAIGDHVPIDVTPVPASLPAPTPTPTSALASAPAAVAVLAPTPVPMPEPAVAVAVTAPVPVPAAVPAQVPAPDGVKVLPQTSAKHFSPPVATHQNEIPSRSLQGVWSGTMFCGSYVGPGQVKTPGPFNARIQLMVNGVNAQWERGNADYSETLHGTLKQNAGLNLKGEGRNHVNPEKPWTTEVQAKLNSNASSALNGAADIFAYGGQLSRSCKVQLTKQ